ncbi:MAG: YraN family protein [Weeksellaceae bacterium]
MFDGHNHAVGRLGEQKAAAYLIDHNYNIIEQNANSRWGEIDIIAKQKQTIVFVEVKTRISSRQGEPFEAVHYLKLRHLLRTIKYYILTHKLEKYRHRIDVISVVMDSNREVLTLKHYENVQVDKYI